METRLKRQCAQNAPNLFDTLVKDVLGLVFKRLDKIDVYMLNSAYGNMSHVHPQKVLKWAIRGGNAHVLEWVIHNIIGTTTRSMAWMDMAAYLGHVEVVKCLQRFKFSQRYRILDVVVEGTGDLDTFVYLYNENTWTHCKFYLSYNGHLPLLRWATPLFSLGNAFSCAVLNRRRDTIEYLRRTIADPYAFVDIELLSEAEIIEAWKFLSFECEMPFKTHSAHWLCIIHEWWDGCRFLVSRGLMLTDAMRRYPHLPDDVKN